MSFKFVNASSQTCWLTTTSLPTGITSGISPTIFAWVKKSASKYVAPLAIGTNDGGGSFLDRFVLYQEDNSVFHAKANPYGNSVMDATVGSGFSADNWNSIIGVSTLSGNVICNLNGGTDGTAGTLASAWHGGTTSNFDRVKIGVEWDGGAQSDSQTFYLAHVLIVKRVLNSTERGNLAAGDNPRAIVSDADIIEYWDGSSLTGYKGTVLSTAGTGTITYNDADNPTVDDPPGGDSNVSLSGSAVTGGHGTQAPSHSIALRERFVSLPGLGLLVPGWLTRRTKLA